ncbi:hypothetical protein [Pelagibius sp.]|uniref:hypothetical protein n=1 Tax=Pelagibius sp. TaxID=1931238 RepID=UPI00262D81E8|nr:hypothetical protein [Pelagibius sp.]
MEETKIAAKLPHLDVEITRRSLPEENAETITLRMTAVPSLGAFADHLAKQGSLPFLSLGAASIMNPWSNPWANPLLMWTRLTQAAWAPWMPPMAPLLPQQRDDDSEQRTES